MIVSISKFLLPIGVADFFRQQIDLAEGEP
jgi:hypothetical protein